MKVLVACEFSGVVRDAFIHRGHSAYSCDLEPSESCLGMHHQGDIRDVLYDGWDLMIAHPPCTYLAVSGARWFKDRLQEQEDALEFVRLLMNAPIRHIAIENPISIISSRIRKPDQIIHPWWFGHEEKKSTCLWLKNLPCLEPTDVVSNWEEVVSSISGFSRVHYEAPSRNRSKNRSRTYQGIADAMSEQWGGL